MLVRPALHSQEAMFRLKMPKNRADTGVLPVLPKLLSSGCEPTLD
ncbi:hypothetical protein SCH4B_4175 [Ruegeria sp. TrichCH4B]|nr:hypothetical protein SCH4B_4175 [Ruegeria sp. TrichCH4B]